MFTKKIRILSFCVVMLMATSLFAGCSEDTSSAGSTADVASTDSGATDLELISNAASTDNLGSRDLGGITIKIGATEKAYLFPEQSDASNVDTAIDNNKTAIVQAVAKRFNVTLEPVELTYGKFSEEVMPSLAAGELVAHIIMPVIWEAGILVSAGVCMDLNSEAVSKYINFKNPWWDSTMAYASTIDGATYCATPNFTSSVDYTFVMYFNKALADKKGITKDLYDLEKNKQWTWDKFLEYAKMGVADLNGDGEMKLEDDQWGFLACPYDSMSAFLTSAGCRTIEVDPTTKKATYALTQANNIETMAKLNAIYTTDNIYSNTNDTPAVESMSKYFVGGKSLFASYTLKYIKNQNMRDMSDEYGILLMPMGPGQTEYMSRADHNTSTVVIPATNNDPTELEATVIVLEALAYATWKQGVSDTIDLYSVQYTCDDESAWAIENVFNCTTYETSQFLYMINGTGGAWNSIVEAKLQKLITETPNADISGEFTSIAVMAQEFIDTLWASKDA